MNRIETWPDFRDEWILYEDEDIIVVDKPVGMPSQASDVEMPDDLVTRLRAHLRTRFYKHEKGSEPYLGVHQRLDRDTSGVLVMTRRREANASIASQFEKRSVEKSYVACVVGWSTNRKTATLRDTLAPSDDGRMRVVRARQSTGPKSNDQLAITHVELLEKGDAAANRSMLSLRLETGRTHQARVQLAHARAAIAGDELYGGSEAPRLLLHASKIQLNHPKSGKRLVFESKVPREFRDWLKHGDRGLRIFDDSAALASAIDRAVERRYALGRSNGNETRATTAFRLVNEAGDALPGLAVDLYADHLVAQFYTDSPVSSSMRDRVLDALMVRTGADGIYVKYRPKQANTLVDTRRDDVAPALPLCGEPAPDTVDIFEEGQRFFVRLGDGLSTGIFLDQRNNRRMIQALAKGKSVANLFAYTCAFSVWAAAGGAWKTVSVDVSLTALERGRDAMKRLSLLDSAEHTFVGEDVFAWLQRARAKGEKFDIVILDPPSYATTKNRRFVASSDYGQLAESALAIVNMGGRLLACTNHRGISHAKFRRVLIDAAKRSGIALEQAKDTHAGSDFRLAPGAESHLKSVLVTLAR